MRVVWTENPEHEAFVSFSSKTTQAASVHLDIDTGKTVQDYAKQITVSNTGTYRGTNLRFQHAKLSELEPSTTYYFRVLADGKLSREYHFVTAPIDDRPFRIVYGGDSRTDVASRQAVNKLIASRAEQDDGLIAFAHGGDYITIADIWSMWDQWLHDHQLTITSTGRILPIIPARGNHEGDGVVYNQVFGFPGGEKDWWRTRIGSDLIWITLDTNSSLAGNQKTFLEKTLNEAQGYRWIAANYHRPAFPAVKSIGPAYEHFVPLFEKYNVDWVCESDGHVLKRTVPIRNGMMDPTGVVYVGEGGLGVSQRTPDTRRWYLRPPGYAASVHHIQIFSVTPDEVSYEAIGLDETVIDRYAFKPRRLGKINPPEVDRGKFGMSSVSIHFTEAMDTTSFTAENVSVDGPNLARDIQYDRSTKTLEIDLGVDPILPVNVTLRELTDLSGQKIDETRIVFPESDTIGEVSRTEIDRPKIETMPVVKKRPSEKLPTAAKQPMPTGCASVPEASPWFAFLLAVWVARKRKAKRHRSAL